MGLSVTAHPDSSAPIRHSIVESGYVTGWIDIDLRHGATVSMVLTPALAREIASHANALADELEAAYALRPKADEPPTVPIASATGEVVQMPF